MDIGHIMNQIGVSPMKFAIFALQQYEKDFNSLQGAERENRAHNFATLELPHIIKIMIEEEKRHANTPFD